MIGKTLSHYRIIEKLGSGGMGVVYKARDEKLRRSVALKVLRPEYAQSEEARRRFLREARAVAAVPHPYIAAIHDAGEENGTLFLVMEYVRGSTLKDLLKKDSYLLRDTLQRCCEIAEGLAHVHTAGIIHRDLKPGNIMVASEGHAKILDFGLAKLVEERDEETKTLLGASVEETSRSIRMGTPAYMAPEQVRGDHVDHRTDVFAFGCTLFEAFTHQPLFGRPSRDETLAAILRVNPALASTLNPDVPQELDWILERCLAKEPRERYQDTRDLVVDLDHLRLKWDSGSLTWRDPAGQGATVPLDPSASGPVVASGSRAKGEAVEVDPWTSSGRSLRRNWKPILLGVALLSLLGVAYKPIEKRIKVTTSQVFYERGLHYLREESETLGSVDNAVQMFHRALARDSTSAKAWAGLGEAYWIRFQLSKDEPSRQEAERAMSHATSLDPDDAAVANAQGRGFLAQSRYDEARQALERAVKADHKLDVAWANLGRAHQGLQNYAEGLQAIQTAIELNPQSFRHQNSLGNFYRSFREREEAIQAYRRAIELKPNSNYAWNNLGSVQLLMEAYSDAAESFRRSIAIVDNPTARSNLGTAYYFQGDFESAKREYQNAIVLEPRDLAYRENLIDALIKLNEQSEIREVSREALDLARSLLQRTPQDASAHLRMATLSARAGDVETAHTAATRCVELQPENVQILFRVCKVYCILNEPEAALDSLERAAQLGITKVEIVNDPDLESLRQHPRYHRILSLAS